MKFTEMTVRELIIIRLSIGTLFPEDHIMLEWLADWVGNNPASADGRQMEQYVCWWEEWLRSRGVKVL